MLRALFITFLMFFSVFHFDILGQNNSLKISDRIDLLSSKITNQSTDPELKKQLIFEYISMDEPELALLEMNDLNGNSQINYELIEAGADIHFYMENFEASLANFKSAYIFNPTTENLKKILLLNYFLQKKESIPPMLSDLKKRDTAFVKSLGQIFQKAHFNKKIILAAKVERFIKEYCGNEYSAIFPNPTVSIISPMKNVSTNSRAIPLTFTVNHARQIQSITVNGKAVYTIKPDDVNKPIYFEKTFNVPVDLHEGENTIGVKAEDALGLNDQQQITVYCTDFPRLAEWTSVYSDTLTKYFRYIKSFVPDSSYSHAHAENQKLIVISTSEGADIAAFQKGLFWYDLFTHPYSGFVDENNTKFINIERATTANIDVVLNDWLLKNMTLQSITNVYINADWKINAAEWTIKMKDNSFYDARAMIKKISKITASGLNFIIDGKIDNPELLYRGVAEMVQEIRIPCAIISLCTTDYVPVLCNMIAAPDSIVSEEKELLPENMAGHIPLARLWKNEFVQPRIITNAAALVRSSYAEMLAGIDIKLKRDKAGAAQKKKIHTYIQDWRRYSEVSRYLSNSMSLQDLLDHADEYLTRTKAEN